MTKQILKIEEVRLLMNDAREHVVMKDFINSTVTQVNEVIEYFAKEGQSLASIPVSMIKGLQNEHIASTVHELISMAGYSVTKGKDVIIVSW